MSGKKSPNYLFVLICAISTISALISDVNAKPNSRFRSDFDNSFPSGGFGNGNSRDPFGSSGGFSSSQSGSIFDNNNSGNSFGSFGNRDPFANSGSNSFGHSSFDSGSSFGHSSAFDNFGSNNAAQTTTQRTRDHGADIAEGFDKLGNAFGALANGANTAVQAVANHPLVQYADNADNKHSSSQSHSETRSNIHQVDTGRLADRYHGQVLVYEPPTVIHFGVLDEKYPVYLQMLPQYVFDYRSSNNKYRRLLAGLALYNLGKISTNNDMNNFHINFNTRPDENCTFIVKQDIFKTDEMKIDCIAITSFIYKSNKTASNMREHSDQINSYVNSQINSALNFGNQMHHFSSDNTEKTVTVMNLDDHRLDGPVFELKPFSECFVTHKYQKNNLKEGVPCGLLEKYSVASLHLHSSAIAIKSSLFVILASLVMFLF